MLKKFIFSNVLGSFVFNENYNLADGLLFMDTKQHTRKKEYEEKLRQKYENLEIPEDKDLHNILLFFKNKKYFSELYKKNLKITKNSIKNSVSGDLLITHAINNIEELNKIINSLGKNLREWYSLYAPEISNKIKDNEKFSSLITKKSKNQLLKEFNINEKESMGANLKDKHISSMILLATQINNFYKLRSHYEIYLKELEEETCPNFAALAGTTIAAKLIEHAGSLKRLVEMPASTLQILGAEKALFRHIRNKKRNLPPKYGIIVQHQLIQKARKEMHGKVARALADKLSIAIKIDYFKGKFIGDKLKKELIDKFKIQY